MDEKKCDHMVGTYINEYLYRDYDCDVDVEEPTYESKLPYIKSTFFEERRDMEKEFKICPLCEEKLDWEKLRLLLPILPAFNPNDKDV